MTPPSSALSKLRQLRADQGSEFGHAIRRLSDDGPAPLSPGQEALWHIHEVNGAGAAYNVHAVFRLKGALDVARLGEALDAVAERHEILRTRFPLSSSGPVQVVEDCAPPLKVEKIRADALPQRVTEEIARSLDIQSAPPVCFKLFALAPDEHVLVIVMHHLSGDGWSKQILIDQLAVHYAAGGEDRSLCAPPIQYRDYAAWSREQDKSRGEAVVRWTDRLRGAAGDVALPYERPRPAARSFRAGHFRLVLSEEATTLLKALARRQDATLFHVLLAGLQVSLCRDKSRSEVVIGTPWAERSHPVTQQLIGYLVNTLALRLDSSGDPTFVQLVQRAKAVVLDALAGADVPFGRVVENLALERDFSRSPVFQTMLNLQSAPSGSLVLPGIAVEEEWYPTGGAKYDLTIDVVPRGKRLEFIFEYAADLFDQGSMKAWGRSLLNILEKASADPARALQDIPVQTEADAALVLDTEKGQPASFADRSFLQAFLRQAELHSKRVALRQGDFAVTYEELADRSGRVAGLLRDHGIVRGDRIAVRMGRSIKQLIALLAVWRCGAVWVPIDGGSPPDRTAQILRDTHAKLIIIDAFVPPADDGLEIPVLTWSEEDIADRTPPVTVHDDNDLAYIMFTSGSTGVPKGVMVPHCALANYLGNAAARFEASRGGAHFSSPTFDLAITNMLAPLICGGKVEIISSGIEGLAQRIRGGARFGLLSMTTSHLRMLLALLDGYDGQAVAEVLVLGAEPVLVEDVRRFIDNFGPCTVVNEYGPTEVTVGCSYFVAADRKSHTVALRSGPAGTVPIGRAIDGAAMHVVDENGRTVAAGGVGRLMIGGVGVAWGYLGSPGLTAERFLPDPGGQGGRVYDSGDLVRRLADGQLEFVGRADRQIKLNGYRIEPGEIEAAAVSCDGVAACHAGVRDGTLVAWIVPSDSVGAPAVAAHLEDRLPRYMVPGAIVVVQVLPLTTGGKLDTASLPWSGSLGTAPLPVLSDDGLRQPSEFLSAVIDAWKRALNGADIGPDSDVFGLGADSLSALRTFVSLRGAHPALTLRQLFTHRTPRKLATLLGETALGGPDTLRSTAVPGGHRERYPASSAQKRLWLQARTFPDDTSYHIAAALRIRGEFHPAALEAALGELRVRHRILDLAVVQTADDDIAFAPFSHATPLEISDDLPGDEAGATRWLQKQIDRTFSLTEGPLWRVAVTRSAQDEHLLVLVIHHLIGDGWSMEVLLGDLIEFYRAAATMTAADLPPAGRSYFLRSAEQARSTTDPKLQAYWTTVLHEVSPVIALPTDSSRPDIQSFRGKSLSIPIEAELLRRLRQLAVTEGDTLNGIVLSVFALLLGRLSGQKNFCIGLPLSGRSDPRDMQSVGLYVNTVPLRIDIEAGLTFPALLRQIREATLAAIEHQDYPLEQIVVDLAPERNASRHPLYQVMFNGLGAHATSAHVAGTHFDWVRVPDNTSKVDLTLYTSEPDGGFELRLAYSSPLFGQPRIEAFQTQLLSLLDQVSSGKDCRIAEYELPPALSQHFAPAAGDAPFSLLDGIAMAMEAHATRPALVQGGTSITYAEVDLRARRLAAALARQSKGAAGPVAILGHREWRISIAALACLRAGLPFCILDAGHPMPYLRTRLAAAAPSLVLDLAGLSLAADSAYDVWNADETPGLDSASPVARQVAALPEGNPSRTAYISFTSGSTGEPKAVSAPASALDAFAGWYLREFALTSADRCAVWSTLGHDPLIRDVIVPLAAGACVVYPPASLVDPAGLAEWLADERITVANSTVSRLLQLPGDTLQKAERLRLLLLGGERLNQASIKPLLQGRDDLIVVNAYGATETPQIVAYGICTGKEAGQCRLTNAVPGSRLGLLTPNGKRAGVGELAEIVISGAGLAHGYLNSVRETALRFRPADRGRTYHTGDLACLDPDGNIVIAGRTDDELTIGGYRIQPAEVEATLGELDGIDEAYVGVVEQDGQPVLCAWVVPTTPGIDAPFLARAARAVLPAYLRPQTYIVSDTLPRLPGGKVDRLALSAHPAKRKMSEPRAEDSIERRVAKVFADCLTIADAASEDDFFALGGHSLLAPRLCAGIRREFGVELTLVELFKTPGVGQIAAGIARKLGYSQADAGDDDALVADFENRHRPFPLTEIQQAYWIGRAEHFDISGSGARIYLEIDIPDLDVVRFQHAWNRLVERHDMLRTVVLDTGEQCVLAEDHVYDIPVSSLHHLSPEDAASVLEQRRDELEHRHRDLATWPLFDLAISQGYGGASRVHISISLIICDAWSVRILERELAALYEDPDLQLSPIGVSFRDYVLHEENRTATKRYAKARAYWESRLETLPMGPDLPLAADARPGAPARFKRIRRTLDAQVWSAVKTRLRASGLTPTGFVLAAFAEAIALHSQSDRFLLTLTLFNREPVHPDIADVVGDFTTISLFEAPGGTPSGFSSFVKAVQERLWSDLDHRAFNGLEVARELSRRRGEARMWAPVVFTSLLGLEGSERCRGLPGSVVYRAGQTPQVWLDSIVHERDGELILEWNIVEGLFPPGLIEGLQECFVSRLGELAGLEDWDVPLLSRLPSGQAERRAAVNATSVDLAPQRLESGFLDWSQREPDRLAVADDRGSVSYGALRAQAAAVAAALSDLAPGSLVGIVMDRGREQVAGVLGTLWAGCTYVPAASDLPPARLDELLRDGGASTVLTQSWLVEALTWPQGTRVVAVDHLAPSAAEPMPAQAVQDLAYVIYTSGSTGRPKGVAISHAAAWNTIADVNARFAIGPEDRVLSVSALSFDLSVWDLFGLLSSGGAVVLPAPAERPDPAGWLAAMASHGVTVWNSAPPLLEIALAEAGERSAGLAGLRLAMVSGDWVAVDLRRRLRRHAADVRVIALGGATEVSIWSNVKDLAELTGTERSVPYGRPLANQRFHVLDSSGRSRPDWVPGELYIGGAGLAQGYWGDAERTHERFVTHPQTGERLYRTGDMGRYLPDGDLEFLGRQDNQVKVQGHRIELAEIEAALQSHPQVARAVVTAPGPRDRRRLVGFVTPADPNRQPDGDGLRRHLGDLLPRYMVPPRIVVLERFPLTNNGKIDRKALPEEIAPTASLDPAADDPLAARMAATWADVLGHASVAPTDNFFHLGGDSVLAARIVVRLREQNGINLSIRTLFENPTPNLLANAVNRQAGVVEGAAGSNRRAHGRISPAPRAGEFPATSVQESIYLAERVANDASLYVVPLALRLSGKLDAAALQRSALHLVRRHEALRTGFVWRGEGLVQIVSATATPSFAIEDAMSVASDERLNHVNAAIADEAATPFPLETGPLARFRLLKMAEEEAVFIATFHHLVTDGTSFQILMRDLDAFYRLESEGDATLPPAPMVQFADFAAWQNERRSSRSVDAEVAYWRDELAGLPARLELPFDYPVGEGSNYIGRWVSREIEPLASTAAQSLAAARGQSVYSILLAAWASTLARFGGTEDVAVAIPMHGRTEDELHDVVGCFANTVLIRADMGGNPSFADLVEQVSDRLLHGSQHQGAPLERIYQALGIDRRDGRMAVAQTNFVMPNSQGMPTRVGTCTVESIPAEETRARYDFTLAVVVDEGRWEARLKYNASLFLPSTAEVVLREFVSLLSAGLEAPEKYVSRLVNTRTQVKALRLTADDVPVSDRIAEMAALFPAKAAVKCGSEILSRAGLHLRANYVAGQLLDADIGRESVVAVSLEPGVDLASILLGIWRAGAAYLPVDETTPDTRLLEILSDAGASLLITDRHVGQTHAFPILTPAELFRVFTGKHNDVELPVISADSLAYVIYTSGSTGKPKGVEVEHRQLSNYLAGVWTRHPELHVDSFAVAQSIAVDFGVTTFWGGLANGATVHLVRSIASEPLAFGDYMETHDIAGLKITPSHLNALLQSSPTPERILPKSVLMLGGESTTWDEITRYRRLRPVAAILNHYGPTEATVGVLTSNLLEVERGARVPLGTPLPNANVMVLDRHMQAVPTGAVGELHIGGLSPARGYRGQGAATAGRFLPEPNADKPGSRMYRTGDLARLRADGLVEFLGRADQQVKIRGFRVEPAEVEAYLQGVPGVKQAVTRHVRDETREELLAYVTIDADLFDCDGAMAILRERLPAHMVPSRIIPIDLIPLLANGKLDRLSLPSPSSSGMPTGAIAPRTDIERLVAANFHRVLGVYPGVQDDFFELGGHSLSAMKLLAALREDFGVSLPMVALFKHPTVEALALKIAGADQPAAVARQDRIEPDSSSRFLPFPMTDIQQAFWVGRSESFEIGNISAHAYWEFDATGIDLDRFTHIFRRLIERHDMLRAIVLPSGELQVLEHVPPFEIGVSDARGLGADKSAALVQAIGRGMEAEVFDLTTWPLFDIRAVLLDRNEIRLFISVDIIIGDAWSFIVLLRELSELYAEPERALPPLSFTFRDYMQSVQRAKAGPEYKQAKTYWLDRLDDLPAAPKLPFAVDPASISVPVFERTRLGIDQARWARLKGLAAKVQATPSALVLAVFAEALALHAESGHFVIDLTLFNRTPVDPAINSIVGDFTSVTLLEVDAGTAPTFVQFIRAVQERLWSDLDHRAFSGIEVMRAKTAQQGGVQYLVPIVFTSIFGSETMREDISPTDLPIKLVNREGQTPQAWIDHMVVEEKGALLSVWNIVEGLFPPGLIEGLQECFVSRLGELAGLEDWDVPLLSRLPSGQAERRAAVNATSVDLAPQRLESGFLDWSQREPDRLAVADDRGSVSYGALRAQAAAVAAALSDLAPGSLVGIVMDRGREQVAGVLGTLWAGCTYVPAASDLPPARLDELLRDGGASTVLTQSWLVEALTWPQGTRVVAVDHLAPSAAEPMPAQAVQDLAYVIYTSGSTGRPKGVAISHAAAWNTIADVNARFAIGPEDRVLSVSALSFDLSVWDLFGLLSSGGAVVLPAPAERPDPAGWLAAMASHGVTVWNSAPPLLEIALAEAGERSAGLAGLRLAMVSGDWVAVDLRRRLRRHAADVRVIALGGATEVSIWSNVKDLAELTGTERSVPYGRPLANQRFHVLDSSGRSRPDWVPGELYIGGAGLAQGYWGDAERTHERFVTHPQTGERLYRTGDMGRYLPDGDLEFLGRQDNQVKVQGHRIELAEIEAALQSHPQVARAVVTAPGPRDRRRLVGFVTPADPNRQPDGDGLRRHLGDLLPRYMVPPRIVVLERFPLTNNGKIDRKALPEEIAPTASLDPAADDPLAARMAATWADVLGHASVAPTDNFFHLGGDSVLAARIVVRLREQNGINLSIRTLFENPTPNLLANAVNRQAGSATFKAQPDQEIDWQALVAGSQTLGLPDKADFALAAHNLRSFPDAPVVSLDLKKAPRPAAEDGIRARRNARSFDSQPIHVSRLVSLLSPLRALEDDVRPKYGYPSAGGLYPVQLYLGVHSVAAASGITGLNTGTYYYNPVDNHLTLLRENVEIPVQAYGDFNRAPATEATFTLLLVADLAAIAPVYGTDSLHFALVEAGAMTQLIEMQAARLGLGIGHIGSLDLSAYRDSFLLRESHVLVHSLVGGLLSCADGGPPASTWTEELL